MATTKFGTIKIKVDGIEELSAKLAETAASIDEISEEFVDVFLKKWSVPITGVFVESVAESLLKSGGLEVDRLMHKNYRVEMTISGPGMADFNVGKMTSEEYGALIDDKSTSFRNRAFNRYRSGTVVIVTFRVSEGSGKRFLISCVEASKINQDAKASQFVIDDIDDIVNWDEDDSSPIKIEYPFGDYSPKNFFVSEHAMKVFLSAQRIMKAYPNTPVKIMVSGPSGYGKTSIAKLYADGNELNYLRMNCAMIRDPEEWFGHREARDGSTIFVQSRFIETVREGNVVIVLDEFNRLEPDLHNTLYPLLDHDAATFVYDQEFAVGPNTLFVATINTGREYTGIFELDAANMNRFDLFLEVGVIPQTHEIDILMNRFPITLGTATEIVKLAAKIRSTIDVHCSIRTTLAVAKIVATGMSVKDAFEVSMLHRIKEDLELGTTGRKELIDIIQLSKV